MKKIIIIGCPGAGKSTFARTLRDKTGLPLFYLDMLWHKKDKSNITAEKFDCKLNEILNLDRWIIDGNYQRTLELRLKRCDTVFFLDFPTDICLQGARERIGKSREDMPWIEETFDEEFRSFIEKFQHTSRVKIHSLLNTYKNKNIIIFKTREELNQYIQNFKSWQNKSNPAKM